MDGASLDRGCLSGHSHDLIPLRGYANSVDVVSSEVLDQAKTGSFLLDNESSRWRHPTPAVIVLKYCPLQVWIFKACAEDIHRCLQFIESTLGFPFRMKQT